jgi:excisionase family DNA binding protein
MKSPAKKERRMTLTQAAGYLGISLRKMAQMVKDGEIKFIVDPLDRRRKLISVAEMDSLKRQSLGGSVKKGERRRKGGT